jgi:hypothetical protein
MDKKAGRPKLATTKDYQVVFRLSEEERKIVEDYCRQYLVSQSQAIRQLIKLAKF